MRTALFVAIALGIHAALYLAYASTVGTNHRVTQVDREFLADNRPLDLLVAGDSHARNAFDARLVPRSASVAVGGEHYLKTLYRLPWLLDRKARPPKTVVLNLDITSFTSWKADHFAPEYVWGRYVPLFELGMRKKQPWAYTNKVLKAKLAPYAGELDTLVQFARGTRAFRTEPGLGRFDAIPPFAQRRVALDSARRHFQHQDLVDPSLDWALVTLLDELRDRGVHVVLVSYPLTREYVEVAQRNGVHAEVRAHMARRLAGRPEVTWLDYEDLYFGRNRLFFDADHLNTLGRPRFTRRLHRDLVAAGLLPRLRPARRGPRAP